MWGPFHNKAGVIVSGKNVWTNKYVKMCEVSQQNNLFLLRNETPSKRKRPEILIALGDSSNFSSSFLFL